MNHQHLLGAMEIFISVVECGSFSASARRLGISQPSVSRQINALEEHLGVRLLQRSTRRLNLTEAGQVYYEKAKQIQHDVIDAQQALSGFRETPSGVLRISAPHVWAETKIMPFLSEFLHKYPEIRLHIECNDELQDIIEDKLDLIIRVGELKDSSYVAVTLAEIRLVLCAAPSYLEQHGRPQTVADLQAHPFIVYAGYNQLLITTPNGVSQQITLNGRVESNTVSVMLSALMQDAGVAALPDLLIGDLLESVELINFMPDVKIQLKELPIHGVYALYSNRKHLPAKVKAFIDFFRPRFCPTV